MLFNNKQTKRVLGLNERYLEYIRSSNSKRAFDIADDKVLSKKVLSKKGIPVPKQLGVITSRKELEDFDFESLPKSFVMKPVHGVRGGGVEIFYNRDNDGNWIKADGSRVGLGYIKAQARDILDGRYSLFNDPDVILLEERVKPHKAFKYYTYKGTPDIRVIVYNYIPVMSYVRLPTKESEGKANLDKGAMAAGIDMAVGKTTYSIIGKSEPIEFVPGLKLPLSGIKIPFWNKILEYSIQASRATGLGFVAVDFLIDKELGPLIVELNARPGLSIQLANHDGLRWRLKKAGGIKVKTVEKGVRLAKDLFGGEIEEGIEAISGKDVIGIYENVTLFGINEAEITTKSKVDTGATISSIDQELARKLGFGPAIEYAADIMKDIPIFESAAKAREYSQEHSLEEKLIAHDDIVDTAIIKQSNGTSYRIQVNLKLKIADTDMEIKATIADRKHMLYPVLIGKKDLRKFLIDPSKK